MTADDAVAALFMAGIVAVISAVVASIIAVPLGAALVAIKTVRPHWLPSWAWLSAILAFLAAAAIVVALYQFGSNQFDGSAKSAAAQQDDSVFLVVGVAVWAGLGAVACAVVALRSRRRAHRIRRHDAHLHPTAVAPTPPAISHRQTTTPTTTSPWASPSADPVQPPQPIQGARALARSRSWLWVVAAAPATLSILTWLVLLTQAVQHGTYEGASSEGAGSDASSVLSTGLEAVGWIVLAAWVLALVVAIRFRRAGGSRNHAVLAAAVATASPLLIDAVVIAAIAST